MRAGGASRVHRTIFDSAGGVSAPGPGGARAARCKGSRGRYRHWYTISALAISRAGVRSAIYSSFLNANFSDNSCQALALIKAA